jgi:hypothetical protein
VRATDLIFDILKNNSTQDIILQEFPSSYFSTTAPIVIENTTAGDELLGMINSKLYITLLSIKNYLSKLLPDEIINCS